MQRRAKVSTETRGDPKLEAFPAYNEIARNVKKEFPVLVQVTAPKLPPQAKSFQKPMRADVDLVLVLDISASITERLDSIKHAMLDVIKKLHSEKDRLCIVSFSERTDYTGLLKMNEEGTLEAITRINNLNASGNSCCMAAALQKAAEILQTRDQNTYRSGFIAFLSASKYDSIDTSVLIDDKFPTYTIGLDDHNREVLYEIAEKTRGTYSFIYKDISDTEGVKSAILPLIDCLKSIVATDMRIMLRTQKGVTISSVETGGFKKQVHADEMSATIVVDDMSAGEKKNFIVLLDIVKGDELPFHKKLVQVGNVKRLTILTVDAEYTNPVLGNKISLQGIEVSVKRPHKLSGEGQVCPQVDDEVDRLKLVRRISELPKNPTKDEWIRFNESIAAFRVFSGVQVYFGAKSFYVLSWLSSQRLQRQRREVPAMRPEPPMYMRYRPEMCSSSRPEMSSRLRWLHLVMSSLAAMPFALQLALAFTLLAVMAFRVKLGQDPTTHTPFFQGDMSQMHMPVMHAPLLPNKPSSHPHGFQDASVDAVNSTSRQIQYLQPFMCLVFIHSRIMGTCSSQLPELVSNTISQLEKKEGRVEMDQRKLACEALMVIHDINEGLLERMAVEVLVNANSTGIAQLGRHHVNGEIKDDLGSLFKGIAVERARRRRDYERWRANKNHIRRGCGVRDDMPRTTFTELGCLVAAN